MGLGFGFSLGRRHPGPGRSSGLFVGEMRGVWRWNHCSWFAGTRLWYVGGEGERLVKLHNACAHRHSRRHRGKRTHTHTHAHARTDTQQKHTRKWAYIRMYQIHTYVNIHTPTHTLIQVMITSSGTNDAEIVSAVEDFKNAQGLHAGLACCACRPDVQQLRLFHAPGNWREQEGNKGWEVYTFRV